MRFIAADEVVEIFIAEVMEFKIEVPVAKEALPKRNGWFKFARTKFAPAWKRPTKELFVEKPVRTMPSEIEGYMLTRE